MRQEKLNEINSYIEELKTKRKELLDTNSRFLKIKRYKSYLNDGRTVVREKLIKGNGPGNASIVLPITSDNPKSIIFKVTSDISSYVICISFVPNEFDIIDFLIGEFISTIKFVVLISRCIIPNL